jgi:hypothetical protein
LPDIDFKIGPALISYSRLKAPREGYNNSQLTFNVAVAVIKSSSEYKLQLASFGTQTKV